ncbi:MAG TPA: BTAD domain-containing putative transcriptional regulator [Streptosporangiaceae bacterium]
MHGHVEARPFPAAMRAVLGLLALAGGSPVRQGSLIEAVWRETPPATAAGLIHTYISRLRSVLKTPPGNDRQLIPARAGSGYRLSLTADQSDLLAFRRAVNDARKASSNNNSADACRLFEKAMGFWRGEPLADVDALREHPAVRALAEERVQATLEYADAALAAGWPGHVLPHLQTLAARNPLDEASHARLLMALAGTGRQAGALALYEELRHRLDEELGVLPGPALREAHAKVLRQEINVQTATSSTGPPNPWRPVFQLPAAPADFTGRAKESKHLISAISPPGDHPGVPVVVISGLPGAGKTALVLFAAHTIRERFPDGQLWVQLAGASSRPRDPGDVLGELLRALDFPGSAIPDDYHERAVCYRSRLADRRVLVIADDAAAAGQVRPLVPGTPGCALMITSRYQLEGLDGAHLMPLDVMTARDAAGFLTRLVGEHRVAADPAAIDQLVAVCGSLPLALRIAGAKLATRPSWPVSAMVRRLTGEHGRLRELEAEELSVRASIASSYQSLSARSRRAFRLLALLGPADFPEWVIGLLLGESDVTGLLDELTSRSLLAPLAIDGSEELRYRLHDLLRDYASERLTEEPPAVGDDALGRLFQGWLQLAQAASAQLPPEPYFSEPASQLAAEVIPAVEAKRLTADPIAWFTTERLNIGQ